MAENEVRREVAPEAREAVGPAAAPLDGPGCDACGSNMQPMGHCKYLCRKCGFLRTCIDTV